MLMCLRAYAERRTTSSRKTRAERRGPKTTRAGRASLGNIVNMPIPALSAVGLRKRYRRGLAVDGVDLTVGPGERVALLGPNGAGKTTTLFMCLGLVTPDAGTVTILGHRLPEERTT